MGSVEERLSHVRISSGGMLWRQDTCPLPEDEHPTYRDVHILASSRTRFLQVLDTWHSSNGASVDMGRRKGD